MNTGIMAFRRYVFKRSSAFLGSFIQPTQFPFTNTFVMNEKSSGLLSANVCILIVLMSHLINGMDDIPLVIDAEIDICL